MSQFESFLVADAVYTLQTITGPRSSATVSTASTASTAEMIQMSQPRVPTAAEIRKGVPEDFMIKEVPRSVGTRIDKYYVSPSNITFRSIKAIIDMNKKDI